MADEFNPPEHVGDTDTDHEALRIPHGAQSLGDYHEGLKIARGVLEENHPICDHPGVKKFMEKSMGHMDKHMGDVNGIFCKSYPDLEPLQEGGTESPVEEELDEEAEDEGGEEGGEEVIKEEEKDKEKKGEKSFGRRRRMNRRGKAMSKRHMSGVKDAAEFLEDHANESNLTRSQKAAVMHHAAMLKSMCAKDEEPAATGAGEDDMGMSPEEKTLALATIAQMKKDAAELKAQLDMALGVA